MAISQSKIVKAACVTEASYKPVTTQPIAPATDGFFLYDNTDPVNLDTASQDIIPLRGSFTKVAPTIGRQLYTFGGTVYASRLETSGSAADDGVLRTQPLLMACGLQHVVGTTTHTLFKPSSSFLTSGTFAATDTKSARLVVELDGFFYDITGVYGTFTMSGTAGAPIEISYDMQGVVGGQPATAAPGSTGAALDPVQTWADDWDGGSMTVRTLKNASVSIGNLAVATTPVLKSFSFTRGFEVGERTDALATDGLAGLAPSDSNPMLELVIEANTADLVDLYADLKAATPAAVSIVHGEPSGASTGERWKIAAPQAVLENITSSEGDSGLRNFTLSYKLIHDVTDDGEFTLEIGSALTV
jgi:hypothetical protein